MKRNVLMLLLIISFAVSTLTIELTSLTKADPIIPELIPMEQAYVRSNGDIDPPTLPIERSGNTYVLKDNILNCTIEIQKDNIMIDGNGFSLTLSPSTELWWAAKTAAPCIRISNKSNITVKNLHFFTKFRLTDYFTGISVENSSNIVIMQNSVNNFGVGLQMNSCINCSVIGNEFTDNVDGFSIEDSIFIYIGYNNISRTDSINAYTLHGGKFANVNFSVITRNNVARFYSAGICLSGNNSENQIFENNFVENSIGLVYQGNYHIQNASSAKNAVYNNYWDNNRQIVIIDVSGPSDDISEVDPSPLTSPISTTFDPSLFTLPSLIPTPSPTPIKEADADRDSLPALVTAVIAVAVISAIGLLIYRKKRKRLPI